MFTGIWSCLGPADLQAPSSPGSVAGCVPGSCGQPERPPAVWDLLLHLHQRMFALKKPKVIIILCPSWSQWKTTIFPAMPEFHLSHKSFSTSAQVLALLKVKTIFVSIKRDLSLKPHLFILQQQLWAARTKPSKRLCQPNGAGQEPLGAGHHVPPWGWRESDLLRRNPHCEVCLADQYRFGNRALPQRINVWSCYQV